MLIAAQYETTSSWLVLPILQIPKKDHSIESSIQWTCNVWGWSLKSCLQKCWTFRCCQGLVPGQLGARFDNIWFNYVADMTSNSWTGNITLCIYLVFFKFDSINCFIAGQSEIIELALILCELHDGKYSMDMLLTACAKFSHLKFATSIFTWLTKDTMKIPRLKFLRYNFILFITCNESPFEYNYNHLHCLCISRNLSLP